MRLLHHAALRPPLSPSLKRWLLARLPSRLQPHKPRFPLARGIRRRQDEGVTREAVALHDVPARREHTRRRCSFAERSGPEALFLERFPFPLHARHQSREIGVAPQVLQMGVDLTEEWVVDKTQAHGVLQPLHGLGHLPN
jgi:hypothetical protein